MRHRYKSVAYCFVGSDIIRFINSKLETRIVKDSLRGRESGLIIGLIGVKYNVVKGKISAADVLEAQLSRRFGWARIIFRA